MREDRKFQYKTYVAKNGQVYKPTARKNPLTEEAILEINKAWHVDGLSIRELIRRFKTSETRLDEILAPTYAEFQALKAAQP